MRAVDGDRPVAGRGRWIGGGLLAGILGAVLVALFAQEIATAASGMGQEIFNAGVLFAAVAMLGWHNIWMSRHGREMAAQMTAVGAEVRAGVCEAALGVLLETLGEDRA